MDMIGSIGDSVSGNQQKTLSGATAKVRGEGAKQSANFEAKQLVNNAKAIEALGYREAQDEALRGDIMISNANAALAASGGKSTDVAGVEGKAKIGQRADYNAAGAIYQRTTDANVERAKAGARWMEGEMAEREGRIASYTMYTGA
jgi:hypothetical protein